MVQPLASTLHRPARLNTAVAVIPCGQDSTALWVEPVESQYRRSSNTLWSFRNMKTLDLLQKSQYRRSSNTLWSDYWILLPQSISLNTAVAVIPCGH